MPFCRRAPRPLWLAPSKRLGGSAAYLNTVLWYITSVYCLNVGIYMGCLSVGGPVAEVLRRYGSALGAEGRSRWKGMG